MNEKTIPLDPRAGLMAALSVAEQLAATGPIQKHDAITTGTTGVRVMLHQRPEDVAEWASAHGLALSLDASYTEGRPYIEAAGSVNGVPVRVWALGEAAELERYAACVPVSAEVAPGVESLPAAWSATAVSA